MYWLRSKSYMHIYLALINYSKYLERKMHMKYMYHIFEKKIDQYCFLDQRYVLYFYLIDEIVFMHPIKVFKLLTVRAFLSSCTWYHMLFTWLFVIQSLNFAERFVPACAWTFILLNQTVGRTSETCFRKSIFFIKVYSDSLKNLKYILWITICDKLKINSKTHWIWLDKSCKAL